MKVQKPTHFKRACPFFIVIKGVQIHICMIIKSYYKGRFTNIYLSPSLFVFICKQWKIGKNNEGMLSLKICYFTINNHKKDISFHFCALYEKHSFEWSKIKCVAIYLNLDLSKHVFRKEPITLVGKRSCTKKTPWIQKAPL